mmetsp:Transcript_20904/g.45946  ORF Transcript_20904/g.45946 Transcript_20904/m.45946 type:complete len:205 (-) Transcript_20904:1404-2018(-)
MVLLRILRVGPQVVLVGGEVALRFCQNGLSFGNSLGVSSTLVCRVLHKLLVVLLGVVLFQLVLVHLRFQIIHQTIDHPQHSPALLLLVPSHLRRRRRLVTASHQGAHLNHGHRHASASQAAWGRSCSQITTVSRVHLLLLAQLTLRTLLVQLRVVKFLETVLGEFQNLNSSLVLRGCLDVGVVFLLACLCCLGNRFVQILNTTG